MVSPSKPPKNRFMRILLAGLDELNMFPSDADRDRAVEAFQRSLGGTMTLKICALNVIVFLVVMFVVRTAGSFFTQAGWIEDLGLVLAVASIILVMRWTYHRTAARHLRRALLETGVAVCAKCGYRLDGLPPDTTVCPECGGTLNERAKDLLRIVSEVRGSTENKPV